ncbi:MAG TPA: hypothetical protein VIZ43_26760, partial [Trebonia sp.]
MTLFPVTAHPWVGETNSSPAWTDPGPAVWAGPEQLALAGLAPAPVADEFGAAEPAGVAAPP